MNFYLQNRDGIIYIEQSSICFNDIGIPAYTSKITEEEYNNYMDEINSGKRLIEKDGEIIAIDPADLLTPEDKDNMKVRELTWQLESLLAKYERYTIPFQYKKLSKENQKALDQFLNECDSLFSDVTIDTIIPELPF